MLPMARLFVAYWAMMAASALFAQSILPSEYPKAPVQLTREAEQRSLAQRYLAAPPGWASTSDQTAPRQATQSQGDRPTSVYLDQTAFATVPEPEPRSTFEPPLRPARADTSTDFQSDAAGSLLSGPELARQRPGVPAAAFDVGEPEPPKLLPSPEVLPRQACAEALTFGTSNRAADGLPGLVAPATYLAGDASDTAVPLAAERHVASDRESTPANARSQPAALPLEKSREALPLKPPGEPGKESGGRQAGRLPSLVTMIGGLAVVLGIFFLVAWGMRRATPGAPMTLPNQVVEVLGRAPLAGRHQVHLLRCGHKLLLVSVTPDTAETLAEITDPFEVDRIAGLCEQSRPNSSSAAFRRVFQQFSHEGKGSHAS